MKKSGSEPATNPAFILGVTLYTKYDKKTLWTSEQLIKHYKLELGVYVEDFKDGSRAGTSDIELENLWDKIDLSECLLELWRSIRAEGTK